MATEASNLTNGHSAHDGAPNNTPQTASVNANESSKRPTKGDIGWIFAQQYYTTLCKSPEKLHLYYLRASQFIFGEESENLRICVGPEKIADRIKELDFKDAKVKVVNIDAQESGRYIVIQIIGDMQIGESPARRFVETFVLAEQPGGWYVLNDIFRYVDKEDGSDVDKPQVTTRGGELEQNVINDSFKQDNDVEKLEKKLEETVAEPEIEPSAVAAIGNEEQDSESTKAAEELAEDKPATPEAAAQAVEEEEQQVVEETPKDPEPTPAPASPVKSSAASVPASTSAPAPAKPAAPKTWASMLSSGSKKAVAVPQVQAAMAAPVQTKTASKASPVTAPAQSPEAVSAPGVAATVAGLKDDSQPPPSPGGWQLAGQEHNRKQHRHQSSALGGQNQVASAYIKNVTEQVDASLLKQTLSKFGKLDYFDVSRPKNCAFVDFDTQAAFQAAVAANPHILNGVEVIVTERHRAGNGFSRGGAARGGRGGMENRTNSQGGRGGFNKDGRGNFANRGARGGPQAQRGRGQAA